MSEQTTGDWMQFFKDAGLPSSIAGNYAVIFVENRIKLEMLMDLSKEYLYDMGIRLMGDVIAILKHAKEYHTELTKERMISNNSGMQRRSPPASHMQGRLTSLGRPSSSPRLSMPAALQHRAQSVAALKAVASRNQKPGIISLKKHSLEDPVQPVMKRVRRVLPEEEGGYRIKMPSGTTERTRKILQSQIIQAGSKKSVFDRLGDSDVSSSTDILKSKNVPSASVFDRLGASNEVSTSTISAGKKNLSISDQPLQYQGVLKTTAATRITVPSTKIITVTKKVKPAVTSTTNKRIVYNTKEVRPTGISRINQILARNAISRASLPPVRRFGIQSRNTQSAINTRSVLNRLGNKGVSTNANNANRVSTRVGALRKLPITVNVANRLSTRADVASRLGSRFGAHMQPQESVFSRLGN